MSFDIFVFDPSAAPRDPKKFLAWYDRQTDWQDSVDYSNPENCTPDLHAWLLEICKDFPPLNGPYAPVNDDGEEHEWTDYSVSSRFIYACFPWRSCETAKSMSHRVAREHNLAVFDASETPGVVTFHDGTSFQVHTTPWWRFW